MNSATLKNLDDAKFVMRSRGLSSHSLAWQVFFQRQNRVFQSRSRVRQGLSGASQTRRILQLHRQIWWIDEGMAEVRQ
jgi:hypothetical protein